MNSSTVTLSTALTTHSGEVKTITLKEPKARSFFENGEPFKATIHRVGDTDQTRIEFDYNNKTFAKFLADMSGIDDGILGNLSASDYFALRSAATNLIIGVAGTDPTPA